jgi:dTDP-glucose pyrophosphorylase
MTTAVVLAAGRGTRLGSLTEQVPKAMVEIGNKPILERIVDDIVASGLREIVFVIGHLGDIIRSHFGERDSRGATFQYVEQRYLNGTGGALQLAEPLTPADFIVVFADSFFTPNTIARIVMSNWRNAIGAIRVDNPQRYGILETTLENRILAVAEKPADPKSNLAIAGIYKLQADSWKYIRKIKPSPRGELELPDAVSSMIDDGFEFGAIEIPFMADIGTPEELKRVRRLVPR